MSSTYEWLYNKYATPELQELLDIQHEQLKDLIRKLHLTRKERVYLVDHVTEFQVRWGAEVFALGLQLGVRLTAPCLSPEDHP